MFRRKHHDHSGHVHYLTTLKGVVGMLRDPYHTESVFDIEDGLRDIDAYQLALERVQRVPEVRELMNSRYLAPAADVEVLAKLPEGTLGRAYADHIRHNGFDADYFRKFDVRSDLDWMLMRIRQTHDIWHVATGFDVGPYGELGLKAFELAQTHRPMAAVITTGGVIRYLMKDPDGLAGCLEYIAFGFRLGTEAKPFLGVRWEDRWEEPLVDLRRELGAEAETSPYRVERIASPS